jgi:hypothetical protein
MSIYPQIIYNNNLPGTPQTDSSIFQVIYIGIFDSATGQATPGNGISVTYQPIYNGTPGDLITINVIGTLYKIFDGPTVINNPDNPPQQLFDARIITWGNAPVDPPASPAVCDAVITTININQKESAPGAANGQITIIAQSSQLPITYSLDGIIFQPSPTFNNLHGGGYTAYISDANGCTAVSSFTVDVIQNLLISDPSVDLGNGNLSRWNAVFNPVVFTYQRKDCEVSGISADGNGNMIVAVNADVTSLVQGDMIYLYAGAYKGIYTVDSATAGQIFIKMPYVASNNNLGFANINRLRPYYQVTTEITYFDKNTNTMQSIKSVNRPDATGLISADISSFLQSLLQVQDDSKYIEINYRDNNLSASYTVRYAENWDGHDPVFISITDPYYVVYSAKQLGDVYGGNLAAYVPFPVVNSATKLARWVTDFAEPAYSNHYPFDIGFIYGDALAGLNIYCELILLDINRQPITGSLQTSFLLNEDNSFLLNQDGSKLIIADASVSKQPIAQCIGLNRLLINQAFPANAYYFTLTLKYDDGGLSRPISQTQTIRIDDMVDDQSVYLRWIGLTGCWNYYRFVYNQEVSLDVQNAVIIKNYVSDWANQNSIEEVISKTAGQKMKVMAEDLSVNDIKGLQSIKYSPKVQMLISKNPVKWQTVVLNTATFAEYETRNGQAPFSVTFNLPGLNIQSQ